MSPGQFLTIRGYEVNTNVIATIELQHERQAQGQTKGGGTDVRIWLAQGSIGGYLPAYPGQPPTTINTATQLPPYIDLGGRDAQNFRNNWNHMRELGLVPNMTGSRETTTGAAGPTTNTATKAPGATRKRAHRTAAKAAGAAA